MGVATIAAMPRPCLPAQALRGLAPSNARPAPRLVAGLLGALTLGALGVLGVHSAAQAQDLLPPSVRTALQRAELPASALGAVALPLSYQATLWRHQAMTPMQPGSAMKLVTSVVALDRLGPNHRGRTTLLSAAPLDGEVLRGDLVLQGGVDPELGLAEFWALLLDLRRQGISHITGDLVIDRHAWRPARPDLGVAPFDDAPEWPYNVIPDALQLMGSLLPLDLRATPEGASATLPLPLPGVELVSRMQPGPRRCADWDEDWLPAEVSPPAAAAELAWKGLPSPSSPPTTAIAAVSPISPITPLTAMAPTAPGMSNDATARLPPVRISLQGAFPRDCQRRAELQLLDRTVQAERVFATLWQQMGGRWDGRAREAEAAVPASPAGPARVLARRESRPWGELLRGLNKRSDNALTRMLYLSLGMPAMAAEPTASTAALAEREVRAWFRQQGIDPQGIVMDNGSGLSRSERISPWQMAQMLRVAHAGRHASDLAMSLPVAGVDGTMRNRLKDSPATGWARLKTGTLRNAVALAGYVQDDRGLPWVVVAFINHEQASRGRPVLDALIDSVARGELRLGPRDAIDEMGYPGW